MAKTMKNSRLRKRNTKQHTKQHKKQHTKQHKKHKMKKSSKRRGSTRKNIKRISFRNFSNARKRHANHHRHRALHNSHMNLHGGKKQKLCDCGCGKKCGRGCGCGPNCGCSCSKTQQTRKRKRKHNHKHMMGGMVSSPASGPVGYPWKGGDEATWPGVAASHGTNTNGSIMSNHFAVSPNGIAVGGIDLARSTSDDPIITPPMNGGRKRGGSNNQTGGFFQEIVNLGRGVHGGINGGYFDLIGKQQPLSQNPWPTEQPIANTGASTITTSGTSPNIDKILANANNKVVGV